MSDTQEAGEPQPLPESSRLALPPRLAPSPDATESGLSWFTHQLTFQPIYQPYRRVQTLSETRTRSVIGTGHHSDSAQCKWQMNRGLEVRMRGSTHEDRHRTPILYFASARILAHEHHSRRIEDDWTLPRRKRIVVAQGRDQRPAHLLPCLSWSHPVRK